MDKINAIIDTVESVSDKFNSKLSSTEKRLLNEVLTLTKEIQTTGGRINSSVENLKLLSQIKSKLNDVVLNKDYLNNVKDLVKGMDGILKVQNDYFSSLAGQNYTKIKDLNKKFEITQKLSIDSVVQGLTKSGIEANVTGKIGDILLRSITSGGMYADLVKDMSNFLTTNENGEGALTRYAQTWVNTSLNQYAGQNNKLMTDDLGLEWFMYVGSNKETTREFCEHLKEKKYIHKSEIPEILKGHIDGHECEIYERTGLPRGMIEGTTPENFQVNNGGWNCGHKLTPVSEEIVPEEIKSKIDVTNKINEYHQVKSGYIEKPNEKGRLQLDITLGVKDLAKKGIDELIKGWYEHEKDKRRYNILNAIISKKEFKSIPNISNKDNKIFIFNHKQYDEKIKNGEMPKNIELAQKLIKHGFDVYLLPNISGFKSADYILLKKNKIYYYEGKRIDGKNTISKRLEDSASQSDRVVLDIVGVKDISYISNSVKEYFENNTNVLSVILFNGSNLISINRDAVNSKNYFIEFRKRWIGNK